MNRGPREGICGRGMATDRRIVVKGGGNVKAHLGKGVRSSPSVGRVGVKKNNNLRKGVKGRGSMGLR